MAVETHDLQNVSFMQHYLCDEQTFMRFVGHNIKNYRIRSGLTQDQLAKNVGMARVSLARIETGSTNTTVKQLMRLARAFNTTPDAFLNDGDTIHISKQQIMQQGLQNVMERILND